MIILIVAPHPDDEVLGCGGTLIKHAKSGDNIHLCIATVGYTPDWSQEYLDNRSIEIKKVGKILGIKKIHMLGYPTVKLDTISQKEINDCLFNLVSKVKPQVVYIPHRGDLNIDHRILHDASLVALRPLNNSTSRILSYEVPSVTEWGVQPFTPNIYSDITETYEAKIEALKNYEGEMRASPHPRSLEVIEAHARKRGSEAGIQYAEAFMLIREIIR